MFNKKKPPVDLNNVDSFSMFKKPKASKSDDNATMDDVKQDKIDENPVDPSLSIDPDVEESLKTDSSVIDDDSESKPKLKFGTGQKKTAKKPSTDVKKTNGLVVVLAAILVGLTGFAGKLYMDHSSNSALLNDAANNLRVAEADASVGLKQLAIQKDQADSIKGIDSFLARSNLITMPNSVVTSKITGNMQTFTVTYDLADQNAEYAFDKFDAASFPLYQQKEFEGCTKQQAPDVTKSGSKTFAIKIECNN